MMRMMYWVCDVVNGCRRIVRSVWDRNVIVRRLRCLAGVVVGVPEW